jgi:iron complex transport system substrate-binding protein
MPKRILALSLVPVALLALAACGDDDDDGDSAAQGTTTTAAAEGLPERIVSLSPTATEMLFAIDAGDQVVAVDDQSDFPKDVPTTKLSGYQPNVEAILEYEPDLVIASDDTGDLVSGLKKARVPTLVLPAAADLDETYSQFERVGRATGHEEEATELVEETRAGIEQAVEEAPDAAGVSYFHELSPDLYTATSETFIGSVYGLFGLENVADEAKGADDYPQLSSEYVVGTDPDLVFLADGFCCGVTAKDVANRPGWQQVPAVADDQVHVIDEDIASRWGPRTLDFVQQVSELLQERDESQGAGS